MLRVRWWTRPNANMDAGQVEPVLSGVIFADVDGPFQQLAGFVVHGEFAVDIADDGHHGRLQLGLVRQLGFNPFGALVEQFAGGDGFTLRAGRRRHLKQPGEKVGHFGGLGRLEPGVVALQTH